MSHLLIGRAEKLKLICGVYDDDVRYCRHCTWQQFVRESQLDGNLVTYLIGTDDERADLLTKAIPKEDRKFRIFRNAILNVEDPLDD